MFKWIFLLWPSLLWANEGMIESTEIHQYECRQAQQSSHYFYAEHTAPGIKPIGDASPLNCHDIDTYGPKDSAQATRLNDRTNFSLWSAKDARFADADNNKQLDLDQEISNKILLDHGERKEVKLFRPLNWITSPFGEKPKPAVIGYFMSFFTNPHSKQSYCPGPDHFKSNDTLMKTLSDYVNYSTQALYIAKRKAPATEAGSVANSDDYILVAETQLKEATFLDAAKIHFRVDYEEGVFQLVDPNQMDSQYGLTSIGSSSDKRLGCIPL